LTIVSHPIVFSDARRRGRERRAVMERRPDGPGGCMSRWNNARLRSSLCRLARVQAAPNHGRKTEAVSPLLRGQFTGEARCDGCRALMRIRAIRWRSDRVRSEKQCSGLFQNRHRANARFPAGVLLRARDDASGYGDVVLMATHCAGTLSVRESWTRNRHRFITSISIARDALDSRSVSVTASHVPSC